MLWMLKAGYVLSLYPSSIVWIAERFATELVPVTLIRSQECVPLSLRTKPFEEYETPLDPLMLSVPPPWTNSRTCAADVSDGNESVAPETSKKWLPYETGLALAALVSRRRLDRLTLALPETFQ